MEGVELRTWDYTPGLQERFAIWNRGLVHHDWVDTRNATVAFHAPTKPLAESRVALVSTGGVHLRTQPRFDVLDPDGDWSIRPIPSDTPVGELAITHSHYNHGDADRDVNCMFPVERLRELVEVGFVGSMSPTFFGMMGFITDGRHCVNEAGPELASRLKDDGTDVVFLTPS